jgi:hypothetical protein
MIAIRKHIFFGFVIAMSMCIVYGVDNYQTLGYEFELSMLSMCRCLRWQATRVLPTSRNKFVRSIFLNARSSNWNHSTWTVGASVT